MDKEIKNTLGDLEFYLKTHSNLPIEEETHPYGECEHMRVVLDDQKHSVTCRDCKKELDPFWYLQLLARQWRRRKYTNDAYVEAARKLKEQEENAKARGKKCSRPQNGVGRELWDAVVLWKGEEPSCIFYRGCWYAEVWEYSEYNGVKRRSLVCYSFDYIKMQLAYKQRGLKENGEPKEGK